MQSLYIMQPFGVNIEFRVEEAIAKVWIAEKAPTVHATL